MAIAENGTEYAQINSTSNVIVENLRYNYEYLQKQEFQNSKPKYIISLYIPKIADSQDRIRISNHTKSILPESANSKQYTRVVSPPGQGLS